MQNLLFQFSPIIQAAIEAGKYVQVFTTNGVPIGMARDPITGRFVAHAIGAVVNNSPLSPLFTPTHLGMGSLQMMQTHRGFQKTYKELHVIQTGLQSLQTSVGVLQATTAIIGVGVAANLAISAVNLYQTLKLREDVKRLRLEVRDGFIDLKQALKDQSAEIIRRIEQVPEDVEFRHHRTILAQAYGRFIKALAYLRDAIKIQDTKLRNAAIGNAQLMLSLASADYESSELLQGNCMAGQLRRKECAWAIDQAITTTYQIQGAYEVVVDRLSHLQNQIRQDTLNVIDVCETEDELDFLFPEIKRIHDHDLAVLNSWQHHVDWRRSLSPEEEKLFLSADFSNSDPFNLETNHNTTPLVLTPEQVIYEELKQKSHPLSLHDQLRFMMQAELRREAETYISQQALLSGHKALIPANLQQASNMAVANLYWYFQVRDESEE
ncbi:MAG: hypothetical protein ACRCZS_22680 [Chroococcidiopsis sp.]